MRRLRGLTRTHMRGHKYNRKSDFTTFCGPNQTHIQCDLPNKSIAEIIWLAVTARGFCVFLLLLLHAVTNELKPAR